MQMSSGKRSRQLLAKNWHKAIFVEVLCGMMYAVLLFTELLLLFSLDLPMILNQSFSVVRLIIMAAVLLLDIMILSPVKLGRIAYYTRLTQTGGKNIRFKVIGSFFAKGKYGAAIRWRITYWVFSVFWLLIWLLPSAATFGFSGAFRAGINGSITADVLWLFSSLIGVFSLMAGIVLWRLTMMRYQASAFLLVQGNRVAASFRGSRRLMKKHLGDMLWLDCSFAGWGILSLLALPIFFVAPMLTVSKIRKWSGWRAAAEMEELNKQHTCQISLQPALPKQ